MVSTSDLGAKETYYSLMVEAKARAASINTFSNDQRGIPSPLVREYCVLQIRMLCEIIGLGCLVAHGDLIERGPKKLSKAFAPGEIFASLDRLHNDYFPVPISPEKTATGWHMAEYIGGPPATKSDIGQIWARCGDILHRGSLKSLVKEKNPVQNDFADVNEWGTKLMNLLSNHRIIRADRQIAFITLLAFGPDVQVVISEATPAGQ